ncbi:hypothetical protein [Fictibacillus phosphorivorans]|uniref:hypothetical protein n=1 Tax=Fictibacillus phosphorivorans TaxID=1221500 RepID=UPI00203D9DE0|nr:hypothetical protein [Fictibacillus phosphorivorans]MCM3718528.1 hypothetical protein [Fictibacillus phosphorivorans]MCM3776116.1 hypothetical protein [Fictibacillus phosphorivorans]
MNLFSSITEESFSYLVNDFGFSEPVATDGSWKTTFLYINDHMGIEVELNYKDMDAFIYIMKLESGKLPKKGEEPVKSHMEDLLNVQRTKSNGDQTTIEQFEKGISKKSELLKHNIRDLMKENKVLLN